jgi:hypothetical protein
LHDSYDTRFDVFTTSRLIIENCKRVKFGEFGTEEGDEYQGFENDMEVRRFLTSRKRILRARRIYGRRCKTSIGLNKKRALISNSLELNKKKW